MGAAATVLTLAVISAIYANVKHWELKRAEAGRSSSSGRRITLPPDPFLFKKGGRGIRSLVSAHGRPPFAALAWQILPCPLRLASYIASSARLSMASAVWASSG